MPIKKIITFIAILFITLNIYSQSRYLENGIGGTCFRIDSAITTQGFNSLGASASYSIGGIMDVGFQLNRSNGTIEGTDSTNWNFDFLYNIIVIKQTDYIPLSLQLEGTYGFSNASAYHLDNNNLTLEGQGFSLALDVFRELNAEGIFSFIIGGKAYYKNFLFTETDNDESDTTTSREENFRVGGLTGFSLQPDKFPIFNLEVEVLYDINKSELYIEPSFLIISPSIR